MLKPEVDLRRTVGWFTTIYPVPLTCATALTPSATELLDAVRETLEAVPHYGIGYGLLRYLSTHRPRGCWPPQRPPDIHFSYLGTIPMPPPGDAPVAIRLQTPTMPVRETIPGLGHAIELRVYRLSGSAAPRLVVRQPPARAGNGGGARASISRVALTELTRQAIASTHRETTIAGGADRGATLVDLSATDAG